MSLSKLERAYRDTTYRVDHPDGVIDLRIGEASARLDALLAAHGAGRWAFITAWNPQSYKKSIEINRLSNEALRATVSRAGHAVYPGRGVPDRCDWQPEESLLVLGISLDEALALGRRYGQRAIVAGEAGGCALLHWCGGDDGDRMSG